MPTDPEVISMICEEVFLPGLRRRIVARAMAQAVAATIVDMELDEICEEFVADRCKEFEH